MLKDLCSSRICSGHVQFILYTKPLIGLIKKHSIYHEMFTYNTTQSLWTDWKLCIHFKIVSKILGYGWKKTTSNWMMIKLKLFISHHHLLSTQACSAHRQSLSVILSLMESSTTSLPLLPSKLVLNLHFQIVFWSVITPPLSFTLHHSPGFPGFKTSL